MKDKMKDKMNLREELIKQFQAEVIEMTERSGNTYYACPTCKRAITRGDDKCPGCSQALSWKNIRQEEEAQAGLGHATLTFEVPGDFTTGDCRRCPLSFIAKINHETVYDCPMKMRGNCRLELS